MALLEVDGLTVTRDDRAVIADVSLAVEEGELAFLIGPNGAGKTALLLAIAGLERPVQGRISLDGRPVARDGAVRMVRRGVVMVPDPPGILPARSVEQNLRIGAWPRRHDRGLCRKNRARALALFPSLGESLRARAGMLTAVDRVRLAIARAIMAEPRVLLLDEPTAGLTAGQAAAVASAVRSINAGGPTVIVAEHHAGLVEAGDRVVGLETGRIIFDGAGNEFVRRPDLRPAYLGTPA